MCVDDFGFGVMFDFDVGWVELVFVVVGGGLVVGIGDYYVLG